MDAWRQSERKKLPIDPKNDDPAEDGPKNDLDHFRGRRGTSSASTDSLGQFVRNQNDVTTKE